MSALIAARIQMELSPGFHLIYLHVPIVPGAALTLVAATLPFGAAVLLPSLWYLFAVF